MGVQAPVLDLDELVLFPFAVATRDELRSAGMVRIEAMGRGLVVFWNDGRPRVYADACDIPTQ